MTALATDKPTRPVDLSQLTHIGPFALRRERYQPSATVMPCRWGWCWAGDRDGSIGGCSDPLTKEDALAAAQRFVGEHGQVHVIDQRSHG